MVMVYIKAVINHCKRVYKNYATGGWKSKNTLYLIQNENKES